ncbi:RagB/SusD family nutrient uptake outer membrane protein [Flavihumibacter sp. UBA7668]|uniref:RagB/SusD family nutrient uptake outer membrane protein n=1 Tax=Flavihumibacter sp. UBA7668 TaxID=1946542 RepID=UPI0025BCF397|nr:RagB/SusD family nutrient uptake outer membrane protein [Flavihumibacter sp. UBA7668]
MKQPTIKLYFFAMLLVLAGCKKMLDVDTISSIDSSSYWKAEGDVEAYLTGIYSDMRALMNSTYHFEDRGDAFVAGLEGSVSTAWEQNLTAQNAPNWINHYNIIYHCNLLLKNAPNISFVQDAKRNRLMAEALSIRAYMYFLLIKSWNNVPLVLEAIESDSYDMPSRLPASEITAQILQDLNEAITLFPEDGFVNKNRASKPLANAIKADVLVWKFKVLQGTEADLQEALTAINQPIAQTSLLQNFAEIFSTANKGNVEIVMGLRFMRDEKSDHYGSRMKPRDIFVATAANKDELAFAINGARSVYSPSPKIESTFNEHATDNRKAASIIRAVNPNGSSIGMFDNKFRGTQFADDRFYDNDIILYRHGGLLLTKAEILAALNRPVEAIAELDKVRLRAEIGPYTGSTTKLTVEREILKERSRELYFEFTRWHDLVRFHTAGTINIYQEVPNLSASTAPLFFPIPQAQIDINNNLTQTEGYE